MGLVLPLWKNEPLQLVVSPLSAAASAGAMIESWIQEEIMLNSDELVHDAVIRATGNSLIRGEG